MNFIQQLLTGNIGTLIMLLVAWKSGLLQFVLSIKKNGNGNGHDRLTEIQDAITTMSGNHLEHLKDGIQEILRAQDKTNAILEEIKAYGIKCRK